MKILYSPQMDDNFKYEYSIFNEHIKVELFKVKEKIEVETEDNIGDITEEQIDVIEYEIVDTYLYDLSNIEIGKEYVLPEFFTQIDRLEDNTIQLEVLNYVKSTEEDVSILFPNWLEAEETEFELGLDDVITELEEVVLKPIIVVDKEKDLLQAQVDTLIADSEFKDALMQDLILQIYKQEV